MKIFSSFSVAERNGEIVVGQCIVRFIIKNTTESTKHQRVITAAAIAIRSVSPVIRCV
jgi:hypothetical protein